MTLHRTPVKAMPRDLRDEAEEHANKGGNIYYQDLPKKVKDDLWQMFKDAIAPLKTAGKLGYLLLQLPPWEFKNRDNFRHIEDLRIAA